jgi:tRNA (guanine26-N2/guanine27-N2)-dimethyltransferase
MEFNRDMAVLTLQVYQRAVNRGLVVCEPLTGCGVRGIRIAAEVDGVDKVIVNDISPEAAELAKFNIRMNKLTEKVTVKNEDANLLLSRYAAPRKRFDYVDIDPFGSPVPYLDSALRALRDGGLIALTATDMAPLCGVHPRACLRKYGGKPLRTEYCHELAVRFMVGALSSLAAKHDIGVTALLSYSQHNHVRTYARLSHGAKAADRNMQKMGYILHCFSCLHREQSEGITVPIKENCPECGSRLSAAGPLWLGLLWNNEFCSMLRTDIEKRKSHGRAMIHQMLSLIMEEAEAPLTYYVIDKVCDKFNLPVPPLSKVISELGKLGFQAVPTHFSTKAVRTDAPAAVLRESIDRLTKSPS